MARLIGALALQPRPAPPLPTAMPRAASRSSRTASPATARDAARTSVGPSLYGVFGRKAGELDGFPLFAGDEAQRHHLDAAGARHVHRRSAGGGAGQSHALRRHDRRGRPRRPDHIHATGIQVAVAPPAYCFEAVMRLPGSQRSSFCFCSRVSPLLVTLLTLIGQNLRMREQWARTVRPEAVAPERAGCSKALTGRIITL